MSSTSEYRRQHPEDDWVCRTCGNNLGWWHPGVWKHQAGQHSTRSCRRPLPILRAERERQEAKALDSVLSALQGRIRLPGPSTDV